MGSGSIDWSKAVIREGTPQELINDPLVRRTYLGDTFRGDEFDRMHAAAQALGEPDRTTPASPDLTG